MDWQAIDQALDVQGHAVLPQLVDAATCAQLRAWAPYTSTVK